MEEGFQIKPCSVKAHKLAGALLLSFSHGLWRLIPDLSSRASSKVLSPGFIE